MSRSALLGLELALGHDQLDAGERADHEARVAARHVEQRRGEQRHGLAAGADRQRLVAGRPIAARRSVVNIVFCRLAIMLRCDEIAPFGRPVVPLV